MSYEVYGPYIPVIMMITFLGLFIWVLLPGNTKGFREASNLPFADEEQADNDASGGTSNGRNK
ncbi:cbb3-type cytochrome oxidase subunit 3 [Aliamphritea ceti]|uniref:cbb3-type cytochrome oxidase subunit 3 n=1 Tax=Aliamphritea ceti TaxID=1524258 RepID=UPI0021C310B6|nr:cbb3-type cytochrome c oxidase subunit 3 [Aliamphritea ceti]